MVLFESTPLIFQNITTSTKEAINLGIYGADFRILKLFFDQTQSSISYLAAYKKFGYRFRELLHIFDAKNIGLVLRKILAIRDSLLSLVSDAFKSN